MSMGKSFLYKKHDRVTSFERHKQVELKNPQPFRTLMAQFAVPPGKYAVIPLVSQLKDPSSRYQLRLHFHCAPEKVKLHSEQPSKRIHEYSPPGDNPDRNMLFRADNGRPLAAFDMKAMVPYSLDALLNARANAPKHGRGPEQRQRVGTIEATIAQNKRDFHTRNVFYEDGAKSEASVQSRLVSQEDR